MRSKPFLVFLVLFLFAMGKDAWANEIYKWVDEKGTMHLSDTPPPAVLKNQDKSESKKQDLNKDKTDDKNQGKNRVKKQDGNSDKLTAKEDTSAILKRLELGNRTIPEDMRKYGPAGPAGYERPPDAGAQAPSPPSVRRSIS